MPAVRPRRASLVCLVCLAVALGACSRDWDELVEKARRAEQEGDGGMEPMDRDGGADPGDPDADVQDPSDGGGMPGSDAGADAGVDGGPDGACVEPDQDSDGVCDADDLCDGDDSQGDDDGDGTCNDLDPCYGDDSTGDDDGDGTCDDSECLFFVTEIGSDDNSGTTWGDAFGTVQAAIDAAALDGCDVWVGIGTYYPTLFEGDDRPADPRDVSIEMKPAVGLYGGFLGGESSREERVLPLLSTVLSGDIGTLDDESDNAYRVVTATTNTVLDGFEVRDGRGVGGTIALGHGGGIYADGADSLMLRDVYITENEAESGAGLYVADTDTIMLDRVIIESNRASAQGGGIYAVGSTLFIGDSLILSNVASVGAGMSGIAVDLDVLRGTFADNRGQGLVVDNADDLSISVDLRDSWVFGNAAGIEASGVGLFLDHSVVVANEDINWGGGISSRRGTLRLTASAVVDNIGGGLNPVGGIATDDTEVTLETTAVVANAGNDSGGGLRVLSNGLPAVIGHSTFMRNTALGGAGLYSGGADLAIVNSSFVGNVASMQDGGGLAVERGAAPVLISGSTFADNSTGGQGAAIAIPGTDLTWVNSIAYNNDLWHDATATVTIDSLCSDAPPPGNNIVDLTGMTAELGDPFDATAVASGERYLFQFANSMSACVDAGNDDLANRDFPEWNITTTATDGALDVSPVDLGRHYDPLRARIRTSDTSQADTYIWGAEGASLCALFVYGVDSAGDLLRVAVELFDFDAEGGNYGWDPDDSIRGTTLVCWGEAGEPSVAVEAY